MNPRRWLTFGVALILSLGGLYFLLRDLDIVRVQAMFRLVDYRMFGLSLLVAVISQVLPAVRWRVLLDNRASYWNCMSALFVSNFISAVVPFRLGEVARAGLINRSEHIGIAASVVTIVAGHILDVLTLLLLGLVLLLVVPLPPELIRASTILAAVIGVGIVGVAAGWHLNGRLAANSLYSRVSGIRQKIMPSLMILREPLRLTQVVSLSLGFWLVTVLSGVLLLFSLVQGDVLVLAAMLTFTAGIGRLLPALPGSIGTVDAAVLLGLVSVGMNHDEAVMLVLLLRLRYTLMTAITGAFGFALQFLTEMSGKAQPVVD